ncbi:MAG TPA: ankyrin repeat domain-containing protein [Chthonomonadaceae bacterium]|nr:ankyrin repeat domain-containing protein [Chthonomonadaceae bacterium]
MQTENEAYAFLLRMHLQELIERLRQIPPDKWEWQPALPAPSARLLAEHAYAWLLADRQHLLEPDATRHAHTPQLPAGQQALCDALEQEEKWWSDFLPTLTAEQLAEKRKQFGMSPRTVRWFVGHTLQNVIYKNGQLATIYFALGLDGTEPYVAPMPNDYYAQLDAILALPLHAAAFRGDITGLEALLESGADVDARDDHGVTPLIAAITQGHREVIRLLLDRGADVQAQDKEGYTALQYAEAFGPPEAVALLRNRLPEESAR